MIHLRLHENTEINPVDHQMVDNYFRGKDAPTIYFEKSTVTLSGYEVANVSGIGSITMVSDGMPTGTITYHRGWVTLRYDNVYDLMRGLLRDKLLLKLALEEMKDAHGASRHLLMRRKHVTDAEAEIAVGEIRNNISLSFEGPVKNRMFDLLENVKIRDSLNRENRERWTLILQSLIQNIMQSRDTTETYAKKHDELYKLTLNYIHALADRLHSVLAQVNDIVTAPWANFGTHGVTSAQDWDRLHKARETIVLPLVADLEGVCAQPFYDTFQAAREFLDRLANYMDKIYKDRPEGNAVAEATYMIRNLASGAARVLYAACLREYLEPANGLASSIMEEIAISGSQEIGMLHFTKRLREAAERSSELRNSLSNKISTKTSDHAFSGVIRSMDVFARSPEYWNREEIRMAMSLLERTYLY